jgi:hypothetical protein
MHPSTSQAIAAERRRDFREQAAASRRAREIQRPQQARPASILRPFLRVARTGRGL